MTNSWWSKQHSELSFLRDLISSKRCLCGLRITPIRLISTLNLRYLPFSKFSYRALTVTQKYFNVLWFFLLSSHQKLKMKMKIRECFLNFNYCKAKKQTIKVHRKKLFFYLKTHLQPWSWDIDYHFIIVTSIWYEYQTKMSNPALNSCFRLI